LGLVKFDIEAVTHYKNKIHAHLLYLTVKGLSIQNLCLKDTLLTHWHTQTSLRRPGSLGPLSL